MGEKKSRPIAIVHRERIIGDLAQRMIRIKQATGRDVYAFFSDRRVSTEMGSAEEIVDRYLKGVTKHTDPAYDLPRANYLYMRSSDGIDEVVRRLLEAKAMDDDGSDKYVEYEGALLDTTGGKTAEEIKAGFKDSKKYSSEKYYRSIITTENKRQDVIRREMTLRRGRVLGLKEDIAKGVRFAYEDSVKRVEFGVQEGTVVQTITYKVKTTLPDSKTPVKAGTVVYRKGEKAVMEMLNPDVVDLIFDNRFGEVKYPNKENVFEKDPTISEETSKEVISLFDSVEGRLQAVATSKMQQGLTWSVAMRNALAEIEEARYGFTDIQRLPEVPVKEELAYVEDEKAEDKLTGTKVEDILPLAKQTRKEKFFDFLKQIGRAIGIVPKDKDTYQK